MSDLMTAARYEWRQLMHFHDGGPAVLQEVLAAYAEPGRFYHTEVHLAEMTMLLAEHRNDFDSYENILLACLYHDVVYDATRSDNEEASAALWRRDAQRLELGPEQTEQVSILILATKKHQPANGSFDMQLFFDADLAVLGSGRARYHDYLVAIRREYAHVTENAYREGRIAVLKKFLARPQLYFSEMARTRFEAQARQNLADEIRLLQKPDSFIGVFSRNASGRMSFDIYDATPDICTAMQNHLQTRFGFKDFSIPIHGLDETIGTCSNGSVTFAWGYDVTSGFYLMAERAEDERLLAEVCESLNALLLEPRFNHYRTYPNFGRIK
jgi:predicted metal-dependent HD superfamily phosphohydrolase